MTTTPEEIAVRIYLFTYRRNHLLPRALDSLIRQTHRNWICELHNDDPDDQFPAALVAKTGDPRLIYFHHPCNLGPTASFNHAFQPVREPFVSLLEDDNWWEPQLLSKLLAAIAPHPDINVAWANSHLWRETETRQWVREGTIWPVDREDAVSIFSPPDPRQACRHIHSHGAMVLRVTPQTMVPCPPSMPIFAIEPIRERTYPGRLLLVREPLANFAITRETWRSETADENMQILVLLAMTLLSYCPRTGEFFRRIWNECRGARGHQQRALIVAAAMSGQLSRLLRAANVADLALIAGWIVRHPLRFGNLFAAKRRFPDVFAFLQAAADRAREAL